MDIIIVHKGLSGGFLHQKGFYDEKQSQRNGLPKSIRETKRKTAG
jgi:hypothetical protein